MQDPIGEATMNIQDETVEKRTIAVGEVIADRFKITNKISTEAYFEVFTAEDDTDKVDVEMKVSTTKEMIQREKAIYELFDDAPEGFQKVIMCGELEDSPEVSFLVVEKLGKTVKEHWDICGNCFNSVTVARIVLQVLKRLQFIHEKGVLHGNIAPENLVMGGSKESETTIHLVDFSNLKRYMDERGSNGQDIITDGSNIRKIDRSENMLADPECNISYRDDLVALGLMLVKLIKGSLTPEEEASVTDKGHDDSKVSVWKICEGLPPEFYAYVSYAYSLGDVEKPDYDAVVLLFKEFLHKLAEQKSIAGVPMDGILNVPFEWISRPESVTPQN